MQSSYVCSSCLPKRKYQGRHSTLHTSQISPDLKKGKLPKAKSEISEIGSKSEAEKDEKMVSDET